MTLNNEDPAGNGKKIITIAELRQFKGFESIDESKGQELIAALEQMSLILYSVYNNKVLKNEKDFDEL
ncbi:MAG: hypothetical protein J0L87_05950 [Bacteroidetes bacterium]|nr:hypothetical protein [Bacteroidota bacterium]